jgi:hypothetical protein
VERGSDKHGPRLDDTLAAETEGLQRAGRQTHAEEWRQPEPSGEDEPDVDRDPAGTLIGAAPPGMRPEDVEQRAELASYLGKAVYPAVREMLIDRAIEAEAPDAVVALLKRLPSGREFTNINDVWQTLGGQVETKRF